MGDIPFSSTETVIGGPAVTTRSAAGPSAAPPGNALGGGGGLPKRGRFGAENAFRALTVAAGAMVLVIIVAIAIFLIAKAVPALRANTAGFFSYDGWFPNEAA